MRPISRVLLGLGLAAAVAVPGHASGPGRLLIFNDTNVGARVIVDGGAPVDILPHKMSFWTVAAGGHRVTVTSRDGGTKTSAVHLYESSAYIVPPKGIAAWCRTTTGIGFSKPACEQRYKESNLPQP
jgi:hypothetical protein